MITIQNWATNMPNFGCLLYKFVYISSAKHFCPKCSLLISVYLNGLQAHNIYFAFGPPDLLNWCNFCQLMSVTVVVAFSLIALYNGLAFC